MPSNPSMGTMETRGLSVWDAPGPEEATEGFRWCRFSDDKWDLTTDVDYSAPSIVLAICLSIYLSIYLSVYLTNYLSN